MAKGAPRTTFVCQQCGGESLRWLGRCPDCGQWNSLVETVTATASPQARGHPAGPAQDASRMQELNDVQASTSPRMVVPYREVNRVLGGGIVRGSLILVGGDPGIGKSTLLLQMAQAVAAEFGAVLYVSGEESPQQVKLRAERLGVAGKGLYFLAETDLEQVVQRLEEARPALAIVDSIQTMYLGHITSVAGSVGQVRECTLRLMQWAKSRNVPVMIAGHVTKDGAIAGPRLLEHMVDVVLYLEGENHNAYRILRGVKNRFGSTNEVGIFEMGEAGLSEVSNPSEAFLAHRQECATGSAIVPALEGTRPLLVEVQALVSPTASPVPRRIANGIDYNRFLLICAVLSKHLGVGLSALDVVVSVAGGLRIEEPAADLAIALAIVSSLRAAPVKSRAVAMGEIGLSGELRPVSQMDRRLSEAANMGFRACVLPRSSIERAGSFPGLELLGARTVQEAMRVGLARNLTPSPFPKREGEKREEEGGDGGVL